MSDNIHQISHPVKRHAEEEETEGDAETEAEMGLASGSDRTNSSVWTEDWVLETAWSLQ